MEYAGFLLRRERLRRSWSQEGLCKGICAVSYLSKIEQGKAMPSQQVLTLLMQRMGLAWYEAAPQMTDAVEQAYELLFDGEGETALPALRPLREKLLQSPLGPDILLLESFFGAHQPLEEELEVCLDTRQLALQRALQRRYGEAARLYPQAYFLAQAGNVLYADGQQAAALETLQTACDMAAQEGRPRVMLLCRMLMGNCYSDCKDVPSMEKHYRAARRLARALGDANALSTIAYNTAATQMEMGRYREAQAYFAALEQPSRMDLHKLAICCEKLQQPRQALLVLEKARQMPAEDWFPDGLAEEMLELVRLRLTLKEPLRDAAYGAALLACFARCRAELSFGYAAFHLPWVLEWYEANRQYKQALQLMREFS